MQKYVIIIFLCVVMIVCLLFSKPIIYRKIERFETQTTDDSQVVQENINKMTQLNTEMQSLHDKVKADITKMIQLNTEMKTLHDKVEKNATQTQVDRKYIQKAIDKVIDKLQNT